MRLTQFRIWKYRNIQDSGDVQLEGDLTCVVGKNQSGKTALLRGLHKFNPHDKGDKYNLSRDWPRGERRAKDEKHVVCAAKFDLTQPEKDKLATLTSKPMNANDVIIKKSYAGEFEIEIPSDPDLFPDLLHPNVIDELCHGLPKPTGPVGAAFAELANGCADEIRVIAGEGRYSDLTPLVDQHTQKLNAARTGGSPQPQHQNENAFVAAHAQKLRELIAAIPKLPTMHANAHEYIVKSLPIFIYMDDYREFQGSTILDQLRSRRNSKSPTPEDHTVLMILDLAGLDLDRLIEQGNSSDPNVIRERQYDLDDAARSLTKDVAGRWGQTPYRVEFRCDGQKFFTEIEETEKNIGMIPLEEQSKGFRWFFSFDLRFMHDSGGTFENCVLLLDEPGLHLHPGGQADLLKRLDAYAEKNVLVYSTHLPFLVDLREPNRIHVIQQKDGYATVTDDLGASGPDEKMTLQAALGMKLNQHYLISERNLVVEGVDDFYILSELSNLFTKGGKGGLPDDVEITASGGASEAVYMATFMVGQGLKVLALFDSDAEGRQQEERLRTKWITRYKGSRSTSLLLGSAVGAGGDFAIEDMFPDAYYLQKATEAHKDKLAAIHESAIPLVGGGLLVDRVQRGCEKIGISFNKGSVAKLIRRDLSKMQKASELDPHTFQSAEKLFAALNAALSQ
jgi:energy-coupling factor transporter ATP-binding protein EcfA2